ncbi:MAG: proprotein convertase P-domain-containing protein, partial [Deltaproteobacteria bacterium]|nr:proprotein convertase P-domain-containing protein [Deltaproteobacteria bacterium]
PDPGALPGTADDCVPTADTETCNDGIDNDCNGVADCSDGACAGDPACTAGEVEGCGEATHGGGTLAIPDGIGVPYETAITIDGFTDGQTLQSEDAVLAVCVNMEHSWLRDLQIELECPSGEVVVLNEFLGRSGGEVYMGSPIDDDGFDPSPGTGMDYCWSPSASNDPMLEWANSNPFSGTLPAGDNQASSSFGPLVGCDLNGDWTIRAIDDWPDDNGYIFDWDISFNTDIIANCDDWVVE